MLKLEIKLDDSKIRADQKYKAESIYQSLEQNVPVKNRRINWDYYIWKKLIK